MLLGVSEGAGLLLGVADGLELGSDVGLLLGIAEGEGLLLGVTEGLKLGFGSLLIGIVEGVDEGLLLGVAEGLKLKLGLKDGLGEDSLLGILKGEGERLLLLLLGSAVRASTLPLLLLVPETTTAAKLPSMAAVSLSSEWAVKDRLTLPLLGAAEWGTPLCIGEDA